MDFIEENPDKDWDWEEISGKLFLKDKELFIEKEYKIHIVCYQNTTMVERNYDESTY